MKRGSLSRSCPRGGDKIFAAFIDNFGAGWGDLRQHNLKIEAINCLPT